jgi:signal transduction histidine kinase
MTRPLSFSARLLLTSLVTLAVGLGALVVAGNVLLDHRVHAEIANLLQANAEAQLATLTVQADNSVSVREAPNDQALDRHGWVVAGDRVVERATGVSAALDRTAIALARARAFGDHDADHDLRLRVVPITAPDSSTPVGAVVVSQSTAPLESLQKQVFVGSLIIAALVLLAGALALRTAIDRALEPVGQMTARAEDWGAHDLDRRFDLGPPRDELTGLAATLDGLLDRIAASRRHEQRFAGEMAHELRTPIAGLRGRAELALGATGPAAPAAKDEALRAVVAQSARLTDTVDTLLAVARRELDPSAGAVDLAALAREVEDAEVTERDPGAPLPLAEGEPDVLRRALAPLVANARRHARERVTLELSASRGRVRITVRDDGPGLDPALGERAFDPGTRGDGTVDAGGAGLGLPLARRLARSCGGDVRLGPGPGGCFVLELPALAAP